MYMFNVNIINSLTRISQHNTTLMSNLYISLINSETNYDKARVGWRDIFRVMKFGKVASLSLR